MSLKSLPEELQLAIVQQVSKGSLPALARVSHCLHRCATSELYYFVHIQRYSGASAGDLSKNDQQRVWGDLFAKQPPPSTWIFSIDQFLRTMSESTVLRTKVIAATFSWAGEHEDAINHLLDLLAPSVRYLHLVPPPGRLQGPALLAPIVALGIDFEGSNTDIRGETDRNELYTLFCISTLRALILTDVRSFDRFKGVVPNDRARTSNVTCLSFPWSVPAGKDLAEILTWPKALRSFSLELEDYPSGHRSWYGPDTNIADPSRFIDALQQHKEFLEELVIIGEVGDTRGMVDEGTVDLREFHKLRRVGLPREFMFMSRMSRETAGLQKEDVCDLFEILPSALEELHIEISFRVGWTQYFSARPTERGPRLAEEDLDELSNWLCAIALNKPNYPALTKVVLWQGPSGNGHDQYDLESEPGCADLLSAMKAAEIEISWRQGQLAFGE
jgi:hypothetical protein